ncbi:hypothetical protein [Paraburkholderia caledonica]
MLKLAVSGRHAELPALRDFLLLRTAVDAADDHAKARTNPKTDKDC